MLLYSFKLSVISYKLKEKIIKDCTSLVLLYFMDVCLQWQGDMQTLRFTSPRRRTSGPGSARRDSMSL